MICIASPARAMEIWGYGARFRVFWGVFWPFVASIMPTPDTDRIFASVLCVCLEAKHFTSLRLLQVRKGFNSNLGLEREAQNNFPVIRQPRYRPDLQPLDYSLLNAIDDLMAEEERTWPKGFHEEYVDCRARLKQKAFSLDAPTVNDAMASMKRRCVQLDQTGGQLTEKD